MKGMWIKHDLFKEDLIISKLWWAKDSLSELQLNDVRNLIKSPDQMDELYLEGWIADLNLQALYKKAKS
jgi:hypothetical protein